MDKGIKLQAYKQRHGHDINGVRPVMIPDESGEWVSRFDAEHIAEQLQRALSRNAELEAASTMREPSALCVKPLCVKLPEDFPDDAELLIEIEFLDDVSVDIKTAQWLKELRRRRAGTVEGE